MPYQMICVPVALQRYVDFTPVAVRQRELAQVLAERSGAPIRVISVDAPVALMPACEETSEKLERYVAPLREAGLDVSAVYREGKPSTAIRSYVEEIGADLVIAGSHSKRGPLDVGIGSTALALGRNMPATVIMIRPTVEEIARARELMIPNYPFFFLYG